ncbi:MAG: hypothetical protein HQK89_16200 [Nitrospirae bacterium]|nr:hypothetical protein [Nitrospirota bacterium]
MLKIMLPDKLNAESGKMVYDIVSDKLKQRKTPLLLDGSEVKTIQPEGLGWLLTIVKLIKDAGLPKIIIRRPNRIIRDALLLANMQRMFDTEE